jgi:maltooligosyltrehalose trehalohydrolase
MLGERLSQLLSFEELKLAAGAVLLSPFIPLLFMGEEYGEEAPFLYFTSHHDPALVEAVRQGRRKEFAAFAWQAEPPDPQDEATFLRAKLNHQLRLEGHFRTLLIFYRELIRLRKTLAPLARLSKENCEVIGFENDRALVLNRASEDEQAVVALNFNPSPVSISVPLSPGRWYRALDSAEERWHGAGSILPDTIETQGPLKLVLQGKSVAAFARSDSNPGK